jgi:hypothetical protein
MIIMVKYEIKTELSSTNAASHNKNTYYLFETQWLLPLPSGLTFQNPIFCLQNIAVLFVQTNQAALLYTALPG